MQPNPTFATVQDVIDSYLKLGIDEVGERTQEKRRHVLTLFAAEHGQRPLAECKAIHLHTFLKDRAGQWQSKYTRRGNAADVKRAFNWACGMELIDRNPFDRFRNRGELPNRRQPMSEEHFQTCMRFSSPAWRRVLIFLKFSGCRPGELAAMRWKDVRFAESCVLLFRHKTSKKTGRPRIIPLVPTTAKLLAWMKARNQSTPALLFRLLQDGPVKSRRLARVIRHYGLSDRAVARACKALGVIKERLGRSKWRKRPTHLYRLGEREVSVAPLAIDKTDLVFTSCLGYPLTRSTTGLYMRRLRQRAGIPAGVSLYALRHRYGLMGVRNGVNLKLLSLAMGHTSTTMTEHYVSEAGLTDDVKEAALQITRSLPGSRRSA